jgi:hypothetical protein
MAISCRADSSSMATRDDADMTAGESSDDERSMTKRMLDLIHRFDAEERRRGTQSDHDSPAHQRRRDDKPAPTLENADDLIVEPAQPE